jgi:hypothetical protein
MASFEHELEAESELEGEFASEFELEAEGEGEGELESAFAGELEGESELEAEGELGEHEHGEQFLGNLISGIGGLFSESEGEAEGEGEGEGELGEYEFEFEQGEQFFKRAFRGIGRLVRSAAPALKQLARVAAPIAGKAVGGLFGGPAGAMLGSRLAQLAAQQLREQELGGSHEIASEFESGELELGEHELGEHELGEQELGEHEVMSELAEHEAQAEAMAHYAAFTESEHEAEAMAGAAVSITISPRDQRALRALVPNLVRGAAILTRILRMRRATRPFVRVVPTIMRRTVRSLRQGAAAGRPITRQRAGQVFARQTRRVLSSPRYCGAVLRRNVRAVRATARPRAMATTGRRGRSF